VLAPAAPRVQQTRRVGALAGAVAVAAAALVGLATERTARAQGAEERAPDGVVAVVLPVAVVDKGVPWRAEQLDRDTAALLVGLDGLLADTAQDLGLTLDLTHRAVPGAERLKEHELAEQARAMGAALIVPRLSWTDGDIDLRIVVARPGAKALLARVERVHRRDLEVRAAVMLRDLVNELVARHPAPPPPPRAPEPLAIPAKSAGRAALAANATVFGGFVGYSVLRSSGSEDPRLLYPLLAVGAGIGLGGSLIIANEWDVGSGDAWYLAAGGIWPTLAGHLIYEGRFAQYATSPDERWAFGLVGGTVGLSVATLGLALHGASEGGAVVAHSGGGLGLVLGGLGELASRGDIGDTPFTGMGYGAGFGWLAAAALATQIRVAPARVLAIDLGALLGGLGGAALASPLVFEDPTPDQQRAWVGVTAGATLAGAGIAWYASRDGGGRAVVTASPGDRGVPTAGVIGESAVGSRRAPVYGVGWQQRF
jgi:hypothetical protein